MHMYMYLCGPVCMYVFRFMQDLYTNTDDVSKMPAMLVLFD